jgi:NADPH:quinone reductase-like Zn-dependent oxidoreductase
MKSVRFSKFGDPARVLELVDVEVPKPGPRDALVKLTVRPISPYELAIIKGTYRIKPSLPATAGFEGVGVVSAVGEDARLIEPGTRVIVPPGPGTWQEYVVRPADQLVRIPNQCSDESAAQISNLTTAWIIAVEELNLQPEEWILQTGGTSHVGRLLIQLSKVLRFKTINLVRREDQVAQLVALGADEVLWTEHGDFVDQALQITGGKGVRAVVDAVGGQIGSKAFKALGKLGTHIVVGGLSGAPIQIETGDIIGKRGQVKGVWNIDWLQSATPEKRSAIVNNLLNLMADKMLTPPVEASYSLDQITRAVQHAQGSRRSGKILLTN